MSLQVVSVTTEPFIDQEAGTSGLRKPVKVYQGPNYTENFVQGILDYFEGQLQGSTLVLGGDGRYYCKEAATIIIRMCAANGVGRVLVGQNGILSTPAASHLIRKYKALGGILLTASHNPGGPDNDFGIKLNMTNGGAAPSHVTRQIFENTLKIKNYKIVPDLQCPLGEICSKTFKIENREMVVDIIDSVSDYVLLMKEIFNFDALKTLIAGTEGGKPFRILIDAMNGVTGPYAKKIFLDELKAPEGSVIRSTPLEDFGGIHPDPNLTYAASLVSTLRGGEHDFGAAFDGDGDRNMILGFKGFFVSPSDSLAVLAAHLHCIPYFQNKGIKGFARSMPTAAAVDRVGAAQKLKVYEVPTGWKFFCNLLDADLISLCGEESFGTGSSHIREKDGIWAALAWLSVIAHLKMPVHSILREHWLKYGRNFTLRYDYEKVDSDAANKMMEALDLLVSKKELQGKVFGHEPNTFKYLSGDNFTYTDPVDNSTTKKQGIRLFFDQEAKAAIRLSGTGSSGATIRMYFEMVSSDESKFDLPRDALFEFLIKVVLEMSQLKTFIGTETPTVAT